MEAEELLRSSLVRLRAVRERILAQQGFLVAQRERLGVQRQQLLIDAEIRTTRRDLFRAAYQRGGHHAAALFDTEFLAVADQPAILDAIVCAALTAADACDLQLYHRSDHTLRIVAQHGFSTAFQTAFGALATSAPTACAAALVSGEPVLVDDVSTSPIFAGQPTLEPVLAAGIRAVASYPLHNDAGEVFGVLSFHYRRSQLPPRCRALIALGASQALSVLVPPASDRATFTAADATASADRAAR